jgi:mannose-6-phosphate isomerase-like protein (cupin superfamily)
MKKAIVVVFALVVIAGLAAIASQAGAAEGKKSGTAVLIPADELKWNDVPNFPGVKMAVVQGDANKGPHHAFIKLPAGFTAPLHHHTADHYATVLSGTVVFTVDGQDHRLPTGSYFAFTGKKVHVTKCETGSDCLIYNDVRAKWDVVPEAGKATKM